MGLIKYLVEKLTRERPVKFFMFTGSEYSKLIKFQYCTMIFIAILLLVIIFKVILWGEI